MCEAYVSEGSFTIDGIIPIITYSDGATETETSGSQERERAPAARRHRPTPRKAPSALTRAAARPCFKLDVVSSYIGTDAEDFRQTCCKNSDARRLAPSVTLRSHTVLRLRAKHHC